MRKITLSADEHLITLARQKARSCHTTLNAVFREWLPTYTRNSADSKAIDAIYRLKHIDSGGRNYTREELNQR